MTSIPATTPIVPAGDVETVVARLGAELVELERRLAAATQDATSSEDRARAAGADLAASAWTMVRFRRFLEQLVAEADAANRGVVELARRHSRPMLPTAAAVAPRVLPPAVHAQAQAHVVGTDPRAVAPEVPTATGDAPAAGPVDEVWDVLAGTAGRDPDEPFWPDDPAPDPDPETSHRALSTNALLRMGSAVCVAGACFLRFG